MESVLSEKVVPYAENSVRFRQATASDRSALISLCAAYRRADAQEQATQLVGAAVDAALAGDSLIHVYMIELLEESARRGEGATMLVGYLALTVGFSIEAGGRDAFIDELYIEPPVQGRGLGRRALLFAEQLCHQLGVRRVCLEVERENARAKKLYSALGFREHRRHLLSKQLF
jgi:ribosomal protein S18 acetylase RimI-like enzyme